MEPISAAGDDIIIEVKAKPKAARDVVLGLRAGRLEVAVRAAPEAGRANDAIARVLADALGVAPSRVRLVSGATARQKRFRVDSFGVAEARGFLGLLA